jgi:hypothetical protein
MELTKGNSKVQENTELMVQAISYKDWDIRVKNGFNGTPIVSVGHPVIDINSGHLLKTFSIEAPLHVQNEGDVYNHVAGLIVSLEMHEIYENLLVNGVPLQSPHLQIGPGFRTGGYVSSGSPVHPHYLLGWKIMSKFLRGGEYMDRLNQAIKNSCKE